MADARVAEAQWPLFRALVGVGLACAVVIVTLYEVTRPTIEAQRAERLRSAIDEVLPGVAAVRSYGRLADGTLERLGSLASGEDVVHAGFDATGRLIGFAFEGRGPGYQDAIEVLLGYDPRGQRLVGLAVLASRETPGLGDRIRSEQAFLASFRDLDVRLDASGARLAHEVELARPGRTRLPWQIDGVSGATVSSRAVARIAASTTAAWAPALRARLEQFEE